MTAPGFGMRAARLLELWRRRHLMAVHSVSPELRELLTETESLIAEANDRPSCRALPLATEDR